MGANITRSLREWVHSVHLNSTKRLSTLRPNQPTWAASPHVDCDRKEVSKSIYKAHFQSMSIRRASCRTHTQIASS